MSRPLRIELPGAPCRVTAGCGVSMWGPALNRQICLGDNDFVQRMMDAAEQGFTVARVSLRVSRAERAHEMGLGARI